MVQNLIEVGPAPGWPFLNGSGADTWRHWYSGVIRRARRPANRSFGHSWANVRPMARGHSVTDSSPDQHGTGDANAPKVWLVVGEKPGDNAQSSVVADALGWPYAEKMIYMRPGWLKRKPRISATMRYVDRERSSTLADPWPDLVITVGRRLSSVALWIKKQSLNKTQIVLIGKPRRLASRFDLVAIAAQYSMRSGPNVFRYSLPLMRTDESASRAAVEEWTPKLSDMARPLIAVLVGGPTGGLVLDDRVGVEIADQLGRMMAESGGSVFVTTSRRTPPSVAKSLEERLPRGCRFFGWAPDATENPYLGLLGIADRFVVTSDSASMMVEVARLGRPVQIVPLESEPEGIETLLVGLGIWRSVSPKTADQPAGGPNARALARLGIGKHHRDMATIPRLLVEEGRASWLGDAWRVPKGETDDDLARVVARIRAMFSAT